MVQYMYSINEVCGNDQPKKDTFSGLRFMWTKGRDFTSLGVAKYTENCHLGMKRVFQCVSNSLRSKRFLTRFVQKAGTRAKKNE